MAKQKNNRLWEALRTHPWIAYVVLSLAVLLPLLRPGYILTLDMVFVPHWHLESITRSSYLFYAILHFLSTVVSSQILEKVLLFAILFLSGMGGYRLARLFMDEKTDGAQAGYFFAGALYMFNPFVYSRFMAGQFAVLLGYALTPYFVVSLWNLCRRPAIRAAFITTAWAAGISIVSIHTVGLLLILSVVMIGLFAWDRRRDSSWRTTFSKNALIVAGLTLIASSYWLVPALLGKGQMASIVSHFTYNDSRAFATSSKGLGIAGNLLGLQGFWGDAQNLYLVPRYVFSWWLFPVVSLWFVAALGMFKAWRVKRSLAVAMALMGLVSVILAIGVAGTVFAPFNKWLLQDVPFYRGYRESQKFIALLVIVYVYFGSYGVSAIWRFLHRTKTAAEYTFSVLIVVFAVPILCAPLMLWGFHGQLKSSNYPPEWYAVSDYLNAECIGKCQVLYLPWHLYMRYGFAGRIIANPAPEFFQIPIISSSDPEFSGASAYEPTSVQNEVESSLLPALQRHDSSSGIQLAEHNIQYVLLAKEDDYSHYSYLNSQKGLSRVIDAPTLTLYKVKQ